MEVVDVDKNTAVEILNATSNYKSTIVDESDDKRKTDNNKKGTTVELPYYKFARSFQEELLQIIELETQENLFGFLDKFYEKLLIERSPCYTKAAYARVLSRRIIHILYAIRDLNNKFTFNSSYYYRISRILAFYLDLELKVSAKKAEYAQTVVMRITLHLEQFLKLNPYDDNTFILETFIHMERLVKYHKEMIDLLFRRFVQPIPPRCEPLVLPDRLYLIYLVLYKKWIEIEASAEYKQKIRTICKNHIQPKFSLRNNPNFGKYLPKWQLNQNATEFFLSVKIKLVNLIRELQTARYEDPNDFPIIIYDLESSIVVDLHDDDEKHVISYSPQKESTSSYTHKPSFKSSNQTTNSLSSSVLIIEQDNQIQQQLPSSFEHASVVVPIEKKELYLSDDFIDLTVDEPDSVTSHVPWIYEFAQTAKEVMIVQKRSLKSNQGDMGIIIDLDNYPDKTEVSHDNTNKSNDDTINHSEKQNEICSEDPTKLSQTKCTTVDPHSYTLSYSDIISNSGRNTNISLLSSVKHKYNKLITDSEAETDSDVEKLISNALLLSRDPPKTTNGNKDVSSIRKNITRTNDEIINNSQQSSSKTQNIIDIYDKQDSKINIYNKSQQPNFTSTPFRISDDFFTTMDSENNSAENLDTNIDLNDSFNRDSDFLFWPVRKTYQSKKIAKLKASATLPSSPPVKEYDLEHDTDPFMIRNSNQSGIDKEIDIKSSVVFSMKPKLKPSTITSKQTVTKPPLVSNNVVYSMPVSPPAVNIINDWSKKINEFEIQQQSKQKITLEDEPILKKNSTILIRCNYVLDGEIVRELAVDDKSDISAPSRARTPVEKLKISKTKRRHSTSHTVLSTKDFSAPYKKRPKTPKRVAFDDHLDGQALSISKIKTQLLSYPSAKMIRKSQCYPFLHKIKHTSSYIRDYIEKSRKSTQDIDRGLSTFNVYEIVEDFNNDSIIDHQKSQTNMKLKLKFRRNSSYMGRNYNSSLEQEPNKKHKLIEGISDLKINNTANIPKRSRSVSFASESKQEHRSSLSLFFNESSKRNKRKLSIANWQTTAPKSEFSEESNRNRVDVDVDYRSLQNRRISPSRKAKTTAIDSIKKTYESIKGTKKIKLISNENGVLTSKLNARKTKQMECAFDTDIETSVNSKNNSLLKINECTVLIETLKFNRLLIDHQRGCITDVQNTICDIVKTIPTANNDAKDPDSDVNDNRIPHAANSDTELSNTNNLEKSIEFNQNVSSIESVIEAVNDIDPLQSSCIEKLNLTEDTNDANRIDSTRETIDDDKKCAKQKIDEKCHESDQEPGHVEKSNESAASYTKTTNNEQPIQITGESTDIQQNETTTVNVEPKIIEDKKNNEGGYSSIISQPYTKIITEATRRETNHDEIAIPTAPEIDSVLNGNFMYDSSQKCPTEEEQHDVQVNSQNDVQSLKDSQTEIDKPILNSIEYGEQVENRATMPSDDLTRESLPTNMGQNILVDPTNQMDSQEEDLDKIILKIQLPQLENETSLTTPTKNATINEVDKNKMVKLLTPERAIVLSAQSCFGLSTMNDAKTEEKSEILLKGSPKKISRRKSIFKNVRTRKIKLTEPSEILIARLSSPIEEIKQISSSKLSSEIDRTDIDRIEKSPSTCDEEFLVEDQQLMHDKVEYYSSAFIIDKNREKIIHLNVEQIGLEKNFSLHEEIPSPPFETVAATNSNNLENKMLEQPNEAITSPVFEEFLDPKSYENESSISEMENVGKCVIDEYNEEMSDADFDEIHINLDNALVSQQKHVQVSTSTAVKPNIFNRKSRYGSYPGGSSNIQETETIVSSTTPSFNKSQIIRSPIQEYTGTNNSGLNLNRRNNHNMFDFSSGYKRSRGRPKGSKNKKKREEANLYPYYGELQPLNIRSFSLKTNTQTFQINKKKQSIPRRRHSCYPPQINLVTTETPSSSTLFINNSIVEQNNQSNKRLIKSLETHFVNESNNIDLINYNQNINSDESRISTDRRTSSCDSDEIPLGLMKQKLQNKSKIKDKRSISESPPFSLEKQFGKENQKSKKTYMQQGSSSAVFVPQEVEYLIENQDMTSSTNELFNRTEEPQQITNYNNCNDDGRSPPSDSISQSHEFVDYSDIGRLSTAHGRVSNSNNDNRNQTHKTFLEFQAIYLNRLKQQQQQQNDYINNYGYNHLDDSNINRPDIHLSNIQLANLQMANMQLSSLQISRMQPSNIEYPVTSLPNILDSFNRLLYGHHLFQSYNRD